jgi:hypothetical protein
MNDERSEINPTDLLFQDLLTFRFTLGSFRNT